MNQLNIRSIQSNIFVLIKAFHYPHSNTGFIDFFVYIIKNKKEWKPLRHYLIIRTDVQRDRQTLAGLDTRERGVKRELANRYAHTLGAEVAETKDTLAVGDDNGAHVVLRPVLQHVVHVALVVDADEETARPAVDQTELLTGEADRRRVHQGHHFLHVLAEELVEELLVAVLVVDFFYG